MIEMSMTFPLHNMDVRDPRILLGYKRHGHMKGEHIGIGGKVDKKESIRDATVGHIAEKTGILADPKALVYAGYIIYEYPDSLIVDAKVHFFTVINPPGVPKETEDIKPLWFSLYDATLVVHEMYRIPLSFTLMGLFFEGACLFDRKKDMKLGGIKWQNLKAKTIKL